MELYEQMTARQLRRFFAGAAVAAMGNFLIAFAMNLYYLPHLYLMSSIFFLAASRFAKLRRFVLFYVLTFILLLAQSFLSVYVIGEDCGIQLYLLVLMIPLNYIRLTPYSETFKNVFIGLAACGCVAGYLISDELFDRAIAPMNMVSQNEEFFFTFFNVVGSLSFLIFLSSIFAGGYQRELQRLSDENYDLEQISNHDTLTGLPNRRGIEKILQKRWREWKTDHKLFTVAIGDLDDFKQINDKYGHDAGDMVLSTLAKMLQRETPETCVVSRWGGEEFLFVISLPQECAWEILNSARKKAAEHEFSYEGETFHITITIGVSNTCSDLLPEEMIQRADKRLYHGKKDGKNCVVRNMIWKG